MVIPSPLTGALIGPALACSYGLIRSRRFARLQFRSLRMPPALFEEYYRDTCAIARPDMTAFLKANASYALKESIGSCAAKVQVLAGGKETSGIRRSAERIHAFIPGSTLTVFPELHHGEYALWHADAYAQRVRSLH